MFPLPDAPCRRFRVVALRIYLHHVPRLLSGANEHGGREPCGLAAGGETIGREGRDTGARGAVIEVGSRSDGNEGEWEGGCETDVGREVGAKHHRRNERAICEVRVAGRRRWLGHGGERGRELSVGRVGGGGEAKVKMDWDRGWGIRRMRKGGVAAKQKGEIAERH